MSVLREPPGSDVARLAITETLVSRSTILHGRIRKHCAPGIIRDQQSRFCVIDDLAQPLRRIGRIQRQISAAGLQHSQQADDHGNAACETDRNRLVRTYAQTNQVSRELIGLRIKFAIAQAKSS